MNQVIIIGGGLAGLTSALALARQGVEVTLVEKKVYPFHKVCGEYISNEVRPYLGSLDIYPEALRPAVISKFILGAPSGKTLSAKLDMGGFGISRYAFDHYLYQKAAEAGVNFVLGKQVNELSYSESGFQLVLSDGAKMEAEIVVGAYGKRAKLDRQLQRPFFEERSPYIGVKYHILTDFPKDTIALYNFHDGYCGLNKIEEDRYCLCYLTSRQHLRTHGSIPAMEQHVLYNNPLLRSIFNNSDVLYEQPEVINEISFATKEAVKDHVLMAGDSAGMIAPLCGNGMAMAIHAGKIASEEITAYFQSHRQRNVLEQNYTRQWNKLFARRLRNGRQIQSLFGSPIISEAAVVLCKKIPALLDWTIRQTHGQPF